ncbi:MAG: Ig-like domain-containing protein [Patescibacteria group bacterium]|jgi:hypothetical protein
MFNVIQKTSAIVTISAIVAIFGAITPIRAANTATISVSSATGSHTVGEEFSVGIVADGGGQNMSVYKASVSVSNLTVVSLTKGSVSMCTTDPSTPSLSFSCGSTGDGVGTITVYTLVVKGTNAGTATISLSGGQVVSSGDEPANILSSVSGGSYTIAAAPVIPDPIPDTPTTPDVPATNPADTTPTTPSTTKKTTTPSSATTATPAATTPAATAETPAVMTETPVPATAEAPVLVAPTMPDSEKKFQKEIKKISASSETTILLNSDQAVVANIQDKKSLTNLTFKGISKPNSLVTVYVFSTLITKSVTTDAEGKWSITVSDGIEAGVHKAYALSTTATETTKAADELTFQVDPEKAYATPIVIQNDWSSGLLQNPWFWSSVALLLGLLLLGFFLYRNRKIDLKMTGRAQGSTPATITATPISTFTSTAPPISTPTPETENPVVDNNNDINHFN